MAVHSTTQLANGNTLTLVETVVVYCGTRLPAKWEVVERDEVGARVQLRRYDDRAEAEAWIKEVA